MSGLSGQAKRWLRHTSPRVFNALARAARPSASDSPLRRVRQRVVEGALRDAQRVFDERFPVDTAALQALAADSALIVVSGEPFDNLDAVIEALHRERVIPGALVIVDCTAETPQLVAIRDRLLEWRFRLPLTRFVVHPYSRQDVHFADAVEQGLDATDARYVWIAGRHFVPLAGCFEYMLKALLSASDDAVIVSASAEPHLKLRASPLDAATLQAAVSLQMQQSETFPFEAVPRTTVSGLRAMPPLPSQETFRDSFFGGARTALMDESGRVFDRRFATNLAVCDVALRLREQHKIVHGTNAAAAWSVLPSASDATAPWEALHDWRWLLDKRTGATAEPDRLELVCPFHRGDVLVSIQVAHLAASVGRPVRLHVAQSLLSWVEQFEPTFEVATIPIPIASAEDTGPQLSESYRYVAQRADASPWLARCHPHRSLSRTGVNLVEFMLEEAGLPRDARLINVLPRVGDAEHRIADEICSRFEGPVVFVHPVGGWRLKSLPQALMAELASHVHAAGLRLVQVGGAADPRSLECDDAILENFRPAQWRALFERGCALLGVDSWSAHFAAILDIPQVCFYGSTHPHHVSSKPWFASQSSACLNMGPIVNCSPCDSLHCVAFPGRQDCTGYAIDASALSAFLDVARQRHLAGPPSVRAADSRGPVVATGERV